MDDDHQPMHLPIDGLRGLLLRARARIDARRRAGLERHQNVVTPLEGPWVAVDGRRCALLCGNDPLALRGHPSMAEAVANGARTWGVGAGASRLIVGTLPIHRELEERLAEYFHAPAALVFPSGFQANLAAMTTVSSLGGCIISDERNHASLIDAMRLSKARVEVIPHGDVGALRKIRIAEDEDRFLVLESLYSMDGNRPDLTAWLDALEEIGGIALVDEAHALGVVGPGGRGLVVDAGLTERVAIRMGTLSKAFGGQGGFVLGDVDFIHWLANEGRSYVYTTGLAPPMAAAALAALDLFVAEPWRRVRAVGFAERFRAFLADHGVDTPPVRDHIVPVIIGSNEHTMQVAQDLLEAGFLVGPIRPPTVPHGTARLRFSFRADLSDDLVDQVAETLVRSFMNHPEIRSSN